MISPVASQLTTPALPQTPSVPLQGGSSDLPAAPAVKLPALPNVPEATSDQGKAGDRVSLSSTALAMGKALNEQADKRSALKKEAEKEQQVVADGGARTQITAGKAYPPFMGNSEALKSLKQSSPALYREILRMIVPPPLNLSPTELQMMQGMQDSSNQAVKLSTTA